ncbi:MAG TPA: AmmeMemoRadiSam system protein B [Rhodocyclaceae bacterium]|nr:AmmeMemoRadiSam system protein B [Rhodocyclaceae bacterium]
MMTPAVRPPAVAGLFYPADGLALQAQVGEMLASAIPADAGAPAPKVMIVPHAGYVYSGPVAANAYAAIARVRTTVRRVVMLGPAHRMPVRGFVLPAARVFATPLGNVDVSHEGCIALQRRADVVVDDAPHALEHCLEVQLPFLQTVLDDFEIVPLLVGDARPQAVAEVLGLLWGGPETLILISSDLSHYHPYRHAQACDRETVEQILQLRGDLADDQACGARPLNGLLRVAALRELEPRLLDLRNSGDTAGDRQRVVGYASIVFTERESHEHPVRH